MPATKTNPLAGIIDRKLDVVNFLEQHWEGTFWEYLDVVVENPAVARNAFQRVYDMITSYGSESFTQFKQEMTRYHYFSDPVDKGTDAIYGLERPLIQFVDFFKSAAQGYGTEKRILLLHGPVGSSKSTIARLLKKGIEAYSKTDAGKLYTYSWRLPKQMSGGDEGETYAPCPMHEEPLLLIPAEARKDVLDAINEKLPQGKKIRLYGDVCPFCRKVQGDLLDMYGGDWRKAVEHVKVKRLILSEKDRRGIGTFQPKDEKNQDSTELTGDINYRKIAEYGSDSDPRAFNFDGELNVANRGVVEFIEVLKLDVAFLYDLLGASQEHLIKPKKFAQTYIDEVILGTRTSRSTRSSRATR
jgi:serine protein kinase